MSKASEIRDYYRASGLKVRVNGKTPDEMTDFEILRWHRKSQKAGEEMLRLGEAPRVKSDDTFFRGYTNTGGAQFTDAVRGFYLDAAREAGVSVSGKQYYSELAAFPGDPRAWVGSRGEMTALLEERNWACEGDLKVRREPTPPPPPVKLADDIAEEYVADKLEAQGRDSCTVKEFNELKAEAVAEHGSPYV